MVNEAKRKSEILEEVRDNINNFLIFDFTGWEKEYERAHGLLQNIRSKLSVLRNSVHNFKEIWHDIRYAAYVKSSDKFVSALSNLRASLTDIVPREKTREAHEYAKSLACKIRNFSSDLSGLMESISDLDEKDFELLEPEALCTLHELKTLSKELNRIVNP